MPQPRHLSRSRILRDACSITSIPVLEFLTPAAQREKSSSTQGQKRKLHIIPRENHVERVFYGALAQASSCTAHQSHVGRGDTGSRSRRRPGLCARQPPRRYSTMLAERPVTVEERYTSDGRLIIETTPPRQPRSEYGDPYTFSPHLLETDQEFAKSTRLPSSFFTDIESLRKIRPSQQEHDTQKLSATKTNRPRRKEKTIHEQMKLLESVRDLEAKLAKARTDLAQAMVKKQEQEAAHDSSLEVEVHEPTLPEIAEQRPVTLTKKDYLNLVDLYFYSHNSRFSPEATDSSPTPLFLNDYSFSLSSKFGTAEDEHETIYEEDDTNYTSPLKEIEEMLRTQQIREISVMQVFVDLLLQDDSSNRALYEAYKELPQPGVAYLPKGVLRLFLQRMSTPWTKSPATMFRYLSLIDHMQQAGLAITRAEWSSAIYLAGRTFNRVSSDDVTRAFSLWRRMEHDAGVQCGHVTLNILFDIAVRAGKFALGETVLQEMAKRNLRLNRFGRVSLMYYHGLRGDGDGVRKAYHDFVEAGEIVDTLVMNCVIASLINAQEPTAAEQIYQRMKDMQTNIRSGWREDGSEPLFKLHPLPGGNRIGEDLAAKHLGRLLERAPRLRQVLPEHHAELQQMVQLVPNFSTFRPMISHHVTVTGDIDRVTFLLNDMLQTFNIPLSPLVFQLLFKGFALHGPRGGPDSPWSKARLDMVWKACRDAIKLSRRLESGREIIPDPTLPAIKDLVKSSPHGVITTARYTPTSPRERELTMWEKLVIDLAAFPRERLKRIKRFHAEQYDSASLNNPEMDSPFFQEAVYSAPQEKLDEQEGEYTLPNPVDSTFIDPVHSRGFSEAGYEDNDEDVSEEQRDNVRRTNQLGATKPMVCWLIRAYSRVTGSRPMVEEIWNSARKVWHPRNEEEIHGAVRVLQRCLKDCDRMSGRDQR